MRFKSGVVLRAMHWRIDHQLMNGSTLDRVFHRHSGRDCMVTGGRDGKHRGWSYIDGSGHYSGEAIDCRTRNLSRKKKLAIAADLRDELGDDWFILIEPTHLHVEIDEEHRYAR